MLVRLLNMQLMLCMLAEIVLVGLTIGSYLRSVVLFLNHLLINNYLPKAKRLPVNIYRDEVEVNIHGNH